MSEGRHPSSSESPRAVFFVCQGPGCSERGGERLLHDMRQALAGSPARRHVRVCSTSCLDSCATGPNVLRTGDGGLHTGVDASGARALVEQQVAALRLPAQPPAPALAALLRPAVRRACEPGGFGDRPRHAADRAG